MSENTIKVAKNEINNNEATKSPDEKPKEVFVVKSVKVASTEGEENGGELADVEPAALEVPGWGDADGATDWASDGDVVRLLAALRGLCRPGGEDVVLRCGAGEVAAHSAILRARSPVLARLLHGGGEAGHPVQLRLDGLKLAGLQAAVAYMNTGVVESGEAGLGPVVEAAAQLQLEGLLRACLPLLQEAGAEEAVEVLMVAESLGLEPLVEAAVAKVNEERAWLVKEPRFRSQMLAQPAALLRLYSALAPSQEAEVRECYGCGAVGLGPCCNWCGYKAR